MRDNIEIKPDFTVDTFTDHAAPTAQKNSFSRLSNYIPYKGYVATRLGITSLAHTPDTSGSPYDPINDPNVTIHIPFEPISASTPWYYCRKNLKPMLEATAGNTRVIDTSVYTVDEQKGAEYCDWFTLPGAGLQQGMMMKESTLTTFPGFTNQDHSFIMSFWWRSSWRDKNTILVSRYDDTQPGGYFTNIKTAAGGLYVFYGTFTNSAGGSMVWTADIGMWNNRWYHVSMYSSVNLAITGVYIYDETAGVEYNYTANASGHCGGTVEHTSMRTTFDGTRTGGRVWFDDLIVYQGDFTSKASLNAKVLQLRARGL